MIVTCPNCETQFNVDDKVYRAGRKSRCSVCGFMFILPAVVVDERGGAVSSDDNVVFDVLHIPGSQTTGLDALSEQDRPEAEAAAGMAESLPSELEDGYKDTEVSDSAPGFDNKPDAPDTVKVKKKAAA